MMIELTSTPIILMVILGVAGMIIPVINVVRKERGSSTFYGAIAFGALLLALGFVIFQFYDDNLAPAAIFSEDVLVDDGFGSFFAIAMLIVSIMTVAGSFNYMRKKSNPAIYFSLILLSSIGMVLIAFATDLVMLFVAWELMSIPTYILAGFNKKNPSSNEAAIKYFLFGALSSGIIIYGISLAYGITGSTNIGDVIYGFANLSPDMLPLGLLAIGMFIAGFGFKMGLVPFHMWLPDTYEGSPPTITALLAAGTKESRICSCTKNHNYGCCGTKPRLDIGIGVIAIMTMTIGNVAAIMQKNLTRMLAYSSIGHAGYILIGISLAPFTGMGLQASLFHILNHAVMKGAAFIAVAGIVTTLAVTHLDKIKGLGRKMPITAFGLVISLLALAGVPPLNGFWSKVFMLFGSAIDATSVVWWAPWLAIAGVLNSALCLAYYGWIIRKMYFEGETEKRIKEPASIVGVMIFSVIFMVTIGVYPEPIIQFVEMITPSISTVMP